MKLIQFKVPAPQDKFVYIQESVLQEKHQKDIYYVLNALHIPEACRLLASITSLGISPKVYV